MLCNYTYNGINKNLAFSKVSSLQLLSKIYLASKKRGNDIEVSIVKQPVKILVC